MSAFLGHIHYWLYNKIRLVIEREEAIYKKAEKRFGSNVEELHELVLQTYGTPLPDEDLTELIDHTNIHGWLQRQINISETREAAFIKELMDHFGVEAQTLVAEAFREHGYQCGGNAKSSGRYDETSAEGIYQTLQDYLLNGMPCDQNDRVIENDSKRFVWEGDVCLQENNWKRVEIDVKIMKNFYQQWVSGFVEALNKEFHYRQTADILASGEVARHELSK